MVKKIKKVDPDIIFVSLGSPKQETFSYRLSKILKENKIIIPVGAAFDFISGEKNKRQNGWEIGDWNGCLDLLMSQDCGGDI